MSHLTNKNDAAVLATGATVPLMGVIMDDAATLAAAALAAGYRHLICPPAALPAVRAAVTQSKAKDVFVTLLLPAPAASTLAQVEQAALPVDLLVIDSAAAADRQAAAAACASHQAKAWGALGEPAEAESPASSLTLLPLGVTAQFAPVVQAAQAAGRPVATNLPFGRGDLALLRPLRRMAERYGKTPAQIVVRWLLQRGILPWLPAASAQELTAWGDVFDFELSFHDTQVLEALDGRPMAPRKHRRH